MDDAVIIAAVEGCNISYGDVRVWPDSDVMKQAAMSGLTERELDERRTAAELARLIARIKSVVRDAEIRHRSIVVSDAELTAAVAKRAEWKRQMSATAEAFRLVEQGSSKDDVYHAILEKAGVTRDAWDKALVDLKDERAKAFLKRIDSAGTRVSEEEIALQRKVLADEKLNAAIDVDIAKSDAAFGEFLEIHGENPADPRLARFPKNYDLAIRQKWWTARFASANIRILHPQFKDVLDRMGIRGRSIENQKE
jgi:hypothetical protein